MFDNKCLYNRFGQFPSTIYTTTAAHGGLCQLHLKSRGGGSHRKRKMNHVKTRRRWEVVTRMLHRSTGIKLCCIVRGSEQRRLCAELGIRGMGSVRFYRQTHDVYTLKSALGHANVVVTEAYLRSLGLER